MKRIRIAVILTFFGASVLAQKDTIFTKRTVEQGFLEEQVIATEADRLFGTKIPSQWMVNLARNFVGLNTAQPDRFLNEGGFNIGVERKVRSAVSLGGQYSVRVSAFDGLGAYHQLTIEQRWYHQMAKRIAEGRSANNLTGRYISLSESFNYWHSSILSSGSEFRSGRNYGLKLRYGLQNRFKKYGFFDFSLGAGLQLTPIRNYGISTGLSFDQNFRLGMGIFENNDEADFSGSYCSVLRCFDESNQMWKVNLLGILRLAQQTLLSTTVTTASVVPNIAVEQKLGKSPFSVELAATAAYYSNGYRGLEGPVGVGVRERSVVRTFQVGIEPRWYYNQTRRIAEGKAGNNLSGAFVALAYQYRVGTTTNYFVGNTRADGDFISRRFHMLWGYQLRVFEHGYAQFRTGIGARRDTDNDSTGYYPSAFMEFEVGFAF